MILDFARAVVIRAVDLQVSVARSIGIGNLLQEGFNGQHIFWGLPTGFLGRLDSGAVVVDDIFGNGEQLLFRWTPGDAQPPSGSCTGVNACDDERHEYGGRHGERQSTEEVADHPPPNDIGCQQGQGFHFSAPLSAGELAKLLPPAGGSGSAAVV